MKCPGVSGALLFLPIALLYPGEFNNPPSLGIDSPELPDEPSPPVSICSETSAGLCLHVHLHLQLLFLKSEVNVFF